MDLRVSSLERKSRSDNMKDMSGRAFLLTNSAFFFLNSLIKTDFFLLLLFGLGLVFFS